MGTSAGFCPAGACREELTLWQAMELFLNYPGVKAAPPRKGTFIHRLTLWRNGARTALSPYEDNMGAGHEEVPSRANG